ncbi:hypothetical protein GCK72_011046 [Caenorhabditis remanei]|uniref:Uncharacterized protein n=1 Tax=Caenorhabditis remanei TaxID=31234 RepID=A0A6A5H8F5_CAERE|nr:hypothetical protein GCK72_011046 [Caenorhabditis remanei]KAF1762783.1 hypothetical protein GCK72_011046 [Caenorhabditis remanei]
MGCKQPESEECREWPEKSIPLCEQVLQSGCKKLITDIVKTACDEEPSYLACDFVYPPTTTSATTIPTTTTTTSTVPPTTSGSNPTPIIIGCVVGGIVFLVIGVAGLYFHSKKTFTDDVESNVVKNIKSAAVKVINVHHEKHEGDYEKYFKTVTLTVKLSDAITADPHGPETFGETIVELVKKFQPDHVNDTTKVGITFKSLELDAAEAVGISLIPSQGGHWEKVVYNLELKTQSNKSPLEIQNPTLDIILKYVVPPSGSGKRKSGFSMRDILDSDMFGKRRLVNSDGE